MKISLNIILTRLPDLKIETHVDENENHIFSGVELLAYVPGMEFSCEKLYYCRLSQAILIPAENRRSATFLCLRDRIYDASETPETMNGIVVINENLGFESLFSQVQAIFISINDWYLKAMEAIVRNRPLQEIIDISEGILENYVQITDSSFTLLGYTRNIDCDDEVTILARQNGFHPESTVRLFERYQRMDIWRKSNGILLNTSKEISKYDLISKIFKYSNTYFAHAVMTCNNRPYSLGEQELFAMFTDLIAVYVEKKWDEVSNCHHTYDPFLHDLYEGNIASRDIAAERSRYLGIPLKGRFCLAITSQNERAKFPLGSIAQEISALRPTDRITNHHGRLIILSQLTDDEFVAQFDVLRNSLEDVMEKYDLRCGISAIFSDLLMSPQAISQADYALSYSGRTPGAEKLPLVDGATNGLQRRAISFEESFFYILLGNNPNNKIIWRSSVYYEALRTLQEYDTRHNINNLHLLYVYLLCESRPTETANIMFMSRNNVVYRIEKIQDLLHMDLKCASVRFKLMTSYVLMQLYGLD